MENSAEYDIITQNIQIYRKEVERIFATGDAERFRKYIIRELAVKMAEKLIEAGYITETWFANKEFEQCTGTIYVKPLVKSK